MATQLFATYTLIADIAKSLKLSLGGMAKDEGYDPTATLKRLHPELASIEDLKGQIKELREEFFESFYDGISRLEASEYIAVKLIEALPTETVAAA